MARFAPLWLARFVPIRVAWFHRYIYEQLRRRVLLKLRIDNAQRIYIISLLGFTFFFLFMGLDYVRYMNGKFSGDNLYFYLLLNHISFFLFLLPILTIRMNREAFALGRFKYGTFFIYSWTIFLGIMLISMAIFSLIDRDSLIMYTIYIIIANFGIIMAHRDRILLNLLSISVIGLVSFFLFHNNMELLLINLMEMVGVTSISFAVSSQIFNAYVREIDADTTLTDKSNQIEKEKNRGDELLNNILPIEIANELKANGFVKPRHFSSATIMLIDFKNFSRISKSLTPQQLIAELDYCFKNFDHITEKHRLEKIKTIGDAYLCVGGVPTSNSTHALDCIAAAREILDFLDGWKVKQVAQNEPFFEGRIGIHTGPIIAGVVGAKKFVFDIWGDAVNTTARVETSGEAGKINISQTTYDLVKSKVQCIPRGKIAIKNLDPLDMYFVEKIANN